MEPKSSLPQLQQPATCPYSKPDKSNPCPLPISHPEDHLNIILPSTLGSLSLRFPNQNPKCKSSLPHSATCPARLILSNIILEGLKQGVRQFVLRSIKLLTVFGIRRNCLRSGGSWSLQLFIGGWKNRLQRHISFVSYVLHPTSCCQD